ncbi:MAG: cupin domain-containing protein [Gemmatimonadaceae bacterium]|nr:cupin domain-containing protein [Gemmatimonadaceae bacterium]
MTTSQFKVLAPSEGLRLQSGPGRDLIFKVTGEDTGGAFDYFIVQVAPHGGPPLHVHHSQEETVHVLKGQFKVRIGDEYFHCTEGDFAYLPKQVPHAFLNLTDEPGEIIVVYTPGGGHKFYEELGPLTRNGSPDPKAVAALFTKYDMTLLGPPLRPD